MLVLYQVLVFLAVTGLTLSDKETEESHTQTKNIFLNPLASHPGPEPCRTSLGERGLCLPINKCRSLREYAEGRSNERIASVIEHFGCGFHEVVYVCCVENGLIKPFEGTEHLLPHYHEDHHHPHAPFFPGEYYEEFPHVHSASEDSLDESSENEKNHPDRKGINNDNTFMDQMGSLKPIYEEPEEVYEVGEGRQPIVGNHSQVPDWLSSSSGMPGTAFGSQGSFSQQQGFQSGKPNQDGFFSGTSINEGFGSGQQSSPNFSGSNNPNNQYLGGRPSLGSTFDSGTGTSSSVNRPITDGFSSGRPSQSGLANQGPQQFVSSSNNRPSQGDFERPSSQGFGNSRPGSQNFGSERPSSQGFGSSRPGSQNFGSERPSSQGFGSSRPGSQNFGSERPSSQGFGSSRPGSQNFGNERPGSIGLSRPDNYDINYGQSNSDKNRPGSNRPGSKRPTNQGNYNEQDSYGSIGSVINGGSNYQGPHDQGPNKKGSKKRPNNSGSKPNRRLLPDGNCGTEINDKIIGGDDTNLDEFPWMALLHFSTRSGQDRGYGCGGSLINERYVLTAAHCIKGPSLPSNTIVNTVRLGEYDITKQKDCKNGVCSPPPIDAPVEEIIVHPEYKPNDRAQHHDIALIRLRNKVPFSTYVSPICLPGDELKSRDYTGKQLVVAGWGKIANGAKGETSAIKQKVSLPFVSMENCKPFYEGINIRLRNTQMCAGGEKAKDSCQGDSGGPLMSNEMVNGQASWFATGIVSFGPEDCGIQNIAGVYTKVSEYVDWITDNIRE